MYRLGTMSEIVIYHNPRCSKSREALAILKQNRAQLRVIEYLKSPPDANALKGLLKKLGLRPRDVIREGEEEFCSLRLDDPNKSDDDLLAAIVAHPILLQRPIVVRGGRAIVARPPAKVKELL